MSQRPTSAPPSRSASQTQVAPPPQRPRSNTCALLFMLAWAAIATIGLVILLVLYVIQRNNNSVVLTALAETSAAGQAAVAAIADEGTAFALTASITDTPTNTPTETPLPTETPVPTDLPPSADPALAATEVAHAVGTGVAQTLTAIATIPTVRPSNTPQPTIPQPTQPAGAQPEAPAQPARPVTLSNFSCRPALGQPNTYQILGTVTNVSGAAYFVEFQAQADIGSSRNFPLSPSAQWVIPEGSPNPKELIYVQFLPDGTNYLRLVARVTACPNNDCNGVAGSADSSTIVFVEGTRDQLCP